MIDVNLHPNIHCLATVAEHAGIPYAGICNLLAALRFTSSDLSTLDALMERSPPASLAEIKQSLLDLEPDIDPEELERTCQRTYDEVWASYAQRHTPNLKSLPQGSMFDSAIMGTAIAELCVVLKSDEDTEYAAAIVQLFRAYANMLSVWEAFREAARLHGAADPGYGPRMEAAATHLVSRGPLMASLMQQVMRPFEDDELDEMDELDDGAGEDATGDGVDV